jgi:hypothetical protein
VTAPRPRQRTTPGQQQDRHQPAAVARQAADRERVRAEVATWPPLAEWQRERLRQLLDLGGGDDG